LILGRQQQYQLYIVILFILGHLII
jgi:hypothetical protein